MYYSEKIWCICCVQWSAFLICRCTALHILSDQRSNCFYKVHDNVQRPIWEPDQTKIGTRSKKIKYCNQSAPCVSIQIHFCYIHCWEWKWKVCTATQKQIPESRKMAEMGVVDRSCLKAPIFADAFWSDRRSVLSLHDTEEVTAWQSGCHVTSLFTVSSAVNTYTWNSSSRIICSCHNILGLCGLQPSTSPFIPVGICIIQSLEDCIYALMGSNCFDLLLKSMCFLPVCLLAAILVCWPAPFLSTDTWHMGRWSSHHQCPACLLLNPVISLSSALGTISAVGLVQADESAAFQRGGWTALRAFATAMGSAQVCSIVLRGTRLLWGYSSKSVRTNRVLEVV